METQGNTRLDSGWHCTTDLIHPLTITFTHHRHADNLLGSNQEHARSKAHVYRLSYIPKPPIYSPSSHWRLPYCPLIAWPQAADMTIEKGQTKADCSQSKRVLIRLNLTTIWWCHCQFDLHRSLFKARYQRPCYALTLTLCKVVCTVWPYHSQQVEGLTGRNPFWCAFCIWCQFLCHLQKTFNVKVMMPIDKVIPEFLYFNGTYQQFEVRWCQP